MSPQPSSRYYATPYLPELFHRGEAAQLRLTCSADHLSCLFPPVIRSSSSTQKIPSEVGPSRLEAAGNSRASVAPRLAHPEGGPGF